jgi:hypothetical protein
MPQKITMSLHTNNNQYSAQQYMATMNQIQKSVQQPKVTTLKTPMIGRIHNVRPGCGSCGRG